MLTPVDAELHDAAVAYRRRELTEEVNLTDLAKVWVARDAKEILGIMGYVLKPDVPVMRANRIDALRALAERYNSFLSDNGARGRETFIHVSRKEKPEQRCPGWAEVLREWDAHSADRISIKVR